MKLYLREVTESDKELLYKWANDEVVRKNSFNTELITYEEHVAWFQKLLKDEMRCQYIMEQEEANRVIPVGQIRVTYDESKTQAEIGYSIDSSYRGMGYGKKMLDLLVQEMTKYHPNIKSLIAKVKPNNVASYKAFVDCGFEEMYKELELKIYE